MRGLFLCVLRLFIQMYKLTSTCKADGHTEVMTYHERPYREAVKLLNFYARESIFTNTHDYRLIAV